MNQFFRRGTTVVRLALLAFATFGFASSAQSALIFDSLVASTGDGFGNTINILSLQNNGDETGAVISMGTGEEYTDDATNKSKLQTLATLMVTDPSQFRLLFDAAEQGSGLSITIESLSVSFYAEDGSIIGTTQNLVATPGYDVPLIFTTTNAGTGINDAIFRLDQAGIDELRIAFANYDPIGNIRVGVAATLMDSWGAADNFSGSSVISSQVPEPATLALLGIGLLGAGASVRRRKQS